jgi:hypothetical protein
MLVAKVKSGEEEYTVEDALTVGRTPDNTISFPDDANISRNHAEIRERDGEYFLTDLGSANGTKVNGQPLKGVHKLAPGDFIYFGNSKWAVFNVVGEVDPEAEEEDESAEEAVAAEPEPDPVQARKSKKMLAGAGGALVLALTIGGGAMYLTSGSACAATAKIVSPEPGDTIAQPTDIEVEAENGGCVAKAVFTLDGVQFASAETEPFEATIDPKDHPDLADGFDHFLNIELYDKNGERVSQTESVQLAFETRKTKPPEDTQIAQNTNQAPANSKASDVSLIEVQDMSKKLVKQFSGNFAYNVSNKEFLKEVQKRAGEYAQDGYFDRAAQYRDQINVAFVREQNLDAPLGYFLAMSRSKFNPAKQGSEEGLFRMSNEFVTANAYNGLCGTETISDPTQNCAAKAAALYMKAMVFGVFEGDVIYSAAAFGKSPQDAGAWKATLPANRTDLWNAIKTAPEREALVRFFAAGIVAENPQKFGLKKDRPLSELYKLAM